MSFLKTGCILEESTAVACSLLSSCVKWLQLDCEFSLEVQALTVGWRWLLTSQVDVFQSSLPTPRNSVTSFADKGGVRFPSSTDRMNVFGFWSKWVVTAFILLCATSGELFLHTIPGSTGEKRTSEPGLDVAIGLCHYFEFCYICTVLCYNFGED